MKDVFELLLEDDLTDDLAMIAEICGMDTVKLLLKNFGGINLYIPKVSRLENFVIKYLKNAPKKPLKLIAKELNVSGQYLKVIDRKIIR